MGDYGFIEFGRNTVRRGGGIGVSRQSVVAVRPMAREVKLWPDSNAEEGIVCSHTGHLMTGRRGAG